jgi:FkbM family methyltransferase
MSVENYENVMESLDLGFDSPDDRSKPLSEREPITSELERLLKRFICHIRPELFVEIGAYEASFSVEMKDKFPDVPVIAIEANPRVYEKFSRKLYGTGVDYLNLAIDKEGGFKSFYIPEKIAGNDMPFAGRMGSLREVGLRDSQTTQVTVISETLDSLLKDRVESNMCLWIDVEGAAERVISSAQKTLERTSIVYVELESSPVWKDQALDDEVSLFLKSSGFIPVARDCQKWFQKNVLFVSRSLELDAFIIDQSLKFRDWAINEFRKKSGD